MRHIRLIALMAVLTPFAACDGFVGEELQAERVGAELSLDDADRVGFVTFENALTTKKPEVGDIPLTRKTPTTDDDDIIVRRPKMDVDAWCTETLDTVNVAADDALAGANFCEADADCTVAAVDVACDAGCGFAVHHDAKLDFERAITTLNRGTCAAYDDAGCAAPVTPSCGAMRPACVANTCQMVADGGVSTTNG